MPITTTCPSPSTRGSHPPLPPTTVSSASWHFSWLRRRSLPEQLFPACAASRTWQLADASTQSGSATPVSQQQQQQQHRTAAAYTANYFSFSHSFCVPQQPHPLHHQQQRHNNAAAATVQQAVIPPTTTPPTAITHRTRGRWPVVSPLPCRTRTPRRSPAVI